MKYLWLAFLYLVLKFVPRFVFYAYTESSVGNTAQNTKYKDKEI